MQTNLLGYPRIGSQRELKKANEQFWANKISEQELQAVAKTIRIQNWETQQHKGIDLIPSNDFSFYDQILDLSLALGAIPQRFEDIAINPQYSNLDLYFAMARGFQKDGFDIKALAMTKWFDTNYHYLVPEFTKNQKFKLFSNKIVEEFKEAKAAGFQTKPVLVGPITYLYLGREKDEDFSRFDLIDEILPVYIQILSQLQAEGATWVQIDENALATDLNPRIQALYKDVYAQIAQACPELKIIITNYFDGYKDNLPTALALPVAALHIDAVRCPEQIDQVLEFLPDHLSLSLGVVDGRNIWKNDYQQSLNLIQKAKIKLGDDRIFVASSCSLLHSPCDLDLETNEETLTPEIKNWMAFAKQKLTELSELKAIAQAPEQHSLLFAENQKAALSRASSALIHKPAVKARVEALTPADAQRISTFATRQALQKESLQLPLFPTTTIGSFPQTAELRKLRADFKAKNISSVAYLDALKKETQESIKWQEEIGLDVLVHGEFERNDMVEYFGEQLEGYTFSKNGWVQSYGSRCVKPPIIFGDVSRPTAMTVYWANYAQSLSQKQVKGMLTGPVTMLQWSFVRNDQSRETTCNQLALAIRDEVVDLEKAGIQIIQIDEPAIREGLPLRKENHAEYLDWAVKAFRISASGVQDATQIHTHMCYSEFNNVIHNIAAMDADVITIECARSHMALLQAFADFKYPNEIGPGVYDIHSPRVPNKAEMVELIEKAQTYISQEQIWINPDCGLKTRHWPETKAALIEMVQAAKACRQSVKQASAKA
jgi:5-methyltetrahydropteroyltriglutamate--homocysteine methyltransferase